MAGADAARRRFAAGLGPVKHAVREAVEVRLPRQRDAVVAADAAGYWSDPQERSWRSNSHWRSGLGDDTWLAVGAAQVEITERLLRASGRTIGGHVVEWGAGGGCNAVHLAPLSDRFTAVDISQASLDECRRQVEAAGGSAETVLIDPERPEDAVALIGAGSVDLFVSFYVFELLPSKKHAVEVVEVARRLLTEDGVAVIQVKYSTGSRRTAARSRDYRRNLANMTTFALHEFWDVAEAAGLRPELLSLVPRDRLDERYAYYLLANR